MYTERNGKLAWKNLKGGKKTVCTQSTRRLKDQAHLERGKTYTERLTLPKARKRKKNAERGERQPKEGTKKRKKKRANRG